MLKSIICGLLYNVSNPETRAPSLRTQRGLLRGLSMLVELNQLSMWIFKPPGCVDLSLPSAMVLVYTRHMRRSVLSLIKIR
jgi:hypothetical protein